MIDICETGDVHDIIIDQCHYQSDIHQFKKFLHPLWDLHDKIIYRLLQCRRETLFVLGDPFSCQDTPYRDIDFLFIRWRLMSQHFTDPREYAGQQQTI
jgi:hypothetical protein